MDESTMETLARRLDRGGTASGKRASQLGIKPLARIVGFAAVALANMRILGLTDDRVNLKGGVVALGHPIGATGARVLTTLLYLMQERQARRGLCTVCLGGGEAIALIVESV